MPIYSFDLSHFEDGKFTATRYPNNVAVGGDWVCRAPNDADALDLARQASLKEWSAPESRAPEDFEVEFRTPHMGDRQNPDLADRLKLAAEGVLFRSAKDPQICVWKDNNEWLVSFMDGGDELDCLAEFKTREEAVADAVDRAKRLGIRAYSQDVLTGLGTTEWAPEKTRESDEEKPEDKPSPKSQSETFKLISVKDTKTVTGTLLEALEEGVRMDKDLQPAFGVTVENASGATVAEINDHGRVEMGDRTTDQWWAWHDADASRWSPGENDDEAVADATTRALSWVAGLSDDGPDLDEEQEADRAEEKAEDRGEVTRLSEIKTVERAEAEITSLDLLGEARDAIARGESVTCFHVGSFNQQAVETVVFANGRAGQANGGDAVWGDWVRGEHLLQLDGPDGTTLRLNGQPVVETEQDAEEADRADEAGDQEEEKAEARAEVAERIYDAADEVGMLQPEQATALAGPTRPDLHSFSYFVSFARSLGCLKELDAVIAKRQQEGDDRSVSEVQEVQYFSHLEQMEGGEATTAILRSYERLMTEAIEAEWPAANYGLRVRYDVSGVGAGIKAVDFEGAEMQSETMRAVALSDQCLARASEDYWKQRRAELTALLDRELPGPSTLRSEGLKAITAGHQFTIERRVGVDAAPVATVVLYELGRAVQTTHGLTVWGNWDAKEKTLATKDGAVFHLDGRRQDSAEQERADKGTER